MDIDLSDLADDIKDYIEIGRTNYDSDDLESVRELEENLCMEFFLTGGTFQFVYGSWMVHAFHIPPMERWVICKPDEYPQGRFIKVSSQVEPYMSSVDAAMKLFEQKDLADAIHAAWKSISARHLLHTNHFKGNHEKFTTELAAFLCLHRVEMAIEALKEKAPV